jgi:hypothetical protein
MDRKNLFVIRIGVSLEGITQVEQTNTANAAEPEAPPTDTPPSSREAAPPPVSGEAYAARRVYR